MEKLHLVTRALHVMSCGFIVGTTFLNYFFQTNQFLADDPNYFDFAHPMAGVIALVTGIANYFILKPANNKDTDDEKENGAKKDESKENHQEKKKESNNEIDKTYLNSIWSDIVKAKMALSMLLTPLVDPLVLFIVSYTESSSSDSSDDFYADIFIDDSDVNATKAKQALNIKSQV